MQNVSPIDELFFYHGLLFKGSGFVFLSVCVCQLIRLENFVSKTAKHYYMVIVIQWPNDFTGDMWIGSEFETTTEADHPDR